MGKNQFNFRPLCKQIIMEIPKYFFRVEFSIEDGTFREPEEVLKTNLHFIKAKHEIENYSYEFKGLEKGKHYTDMDLVYLLKIFTNLNKDELQSCLNGHTINSESFKIL